jgi:hypothetical protein
MLVLNVVGLVGFSKIWFNLIFGMNRKFYKSNIMDLTKKEGLIIVFCILFLLIVSLCPLFILI